MNWDVTYDGYDYESCDSNSDFLVEENNVVSLMVRLAEYGETVVPKDLVRRKGDVSGVLNETITVTEKRLKNIKNDFLKSSPRESNAAAGIWKCEKVPSENLIDKRVIFVIKKCPNKVKNSQKNVTSKRMFYVTVNQNIKKTPITNFVEKNEGKVEDFPNVVVLIDTKDTL